MILLLKQKIRLNRIGGDKMEATCMRCRKPVDIENPEEVVFRNNCRAMNGVCSICGTKVFRILPKNRE